MSRIGELLGKIFDGPVKMKRGHTPDLKGELGRLARVVRRAPEVMVKVTKGGKNVAQDKEHLDYIDRDGDLEVENERGEILIDKEAAREELDAWAAAPDRQRKNKGNFSVHIVLSMPAGTPPEAVRNAVREFAKDEFKNHQYMMVLHEDRPHPHVHMVVKKTGFAPDFTRLEHDKADLAAWREKFAEKLREQGIEAEATPLRARVLGMAAPQIKAAYREVAASLDKVNDPSAHKLSEQIKTFTDTMREPEKERYRQPYQLREREHDRER